MSAWADSRRVNLRLLAWAGFGVLAAVWLLVHLGASNAVAKKLAGDAVIYLVPLLMAAIGAAVVMTRSAGVERRLWALFSLALTMTLASETYLSWYAAFVDPRGPRMPAWFQIVQLVAVSAFCAMLATMTSLGTAPPVVRARMYVDTTGGVVVTAAAIYGFWTLPLLGSLPYAGWQSAAVDALYPTFGLFIVALAASVVRVWRIHPWRAWDTLMVGAVGLFGASMVLSPIWYWQTLTAPQANGGDWYSVALGAGCYVLFMSAVYRLTATHDELSGLDAWSVPAVTRPWVTVAYPVALAAALPVLGLGAIEFGGPPADVPIIVAAFALAVVLVARSWLAGLERAHHLTAAITDPVSGAYNYRYLHERLYAELAQAAEAGRTVAVIVADLENFRTINNQLGHLAGDRILRDVAQAFQQEGGSDCTVYRLGSDEFTVLAPGLSAEEAVALAHRVVGKASRSVVVGAGTLRFSAGVAVFPMHAFDGDQLVSRAVAAQMLARTAEEGDIVVYDEAVVGASDPLERLTRARRRSHRATVAALAAAVDARDPDTRHHSENVADLATALALVLDLSEDHSHLLELAAKMHDVGKIGVRDEVLLKSTHLSPQDRAHIEEHPVLACRILAPAYLDDILPAVRHHHERWDGRGYPDGLAGFEIPLDARVLAICDAFEAMTSSRRYRDALTVPQAIAELERCAGTQFDPDIALVFARMVARLHGQTLRDGMSPTLPEPG